jgi:uncharacterized protein (TIGR04168 family)
VVRDEQGTIYLNAAAVPRILETEERDRLHNFFLVSLTNNSVSQIRLVLVAENFSIVQEKIFYREVEVIPEKLLS